MKTTNKRTVEKRLIKIRSGSSKFCVNLGSWPLYFPRFSDAHRWWRGNAQWARVRKQSVWKRESESAIELSQPNYLGGLGVFRVYDGNQTCCHTTCGSFYQTRGDPIRYKPNIWEIAPAIEYWYPFFGWAHVVGEPVALEPFTYLETPKPKGTRIISV